LKYIRILISVILKYYFGPLEKETELFHAPKRTSFPPHRSMAHGETQFMASSIPASHDGKSFEGTCNKS